MCLKIEKGFSCVIGCRAEKLIFLLCGALLTGHSIRASHCAALCYSYSMLIPPVELIYPIGIQTHTTV